MQTSVCLAWRTKVRVPGVYRIGSKLDIHCDFRASLPQVNAALLEMEAHITRRKPVPGLLSGSLAAGCSAKVSVERSKLG